GCGRAGPRFPLRLARWSVLWLTSTARTLPGGAYLGRQFTLVRAVWTGPWCSAGRWVSGWSSRARTGVRGGSLDAVAAYRAPARGEGGVVWLWRCAADRYRSAGTAWPGRLVPGAGMPHRLRPVAAL